MTNTTWTLNGKLFKDMDDSELSREAAHWQEESRFYNRANGEFGRMLDDIVVIHDTMRYRNYIASKANFDRKRKRAREEAWSAISAFLQIRGLSEELPILRRWQALDQEV